jgi:hypothetical protein
MCQGLWLEMFTTCTNVTTQPALIPVSRVMLTHNCSVEHISSFSIRPIMRYLCTLMDVAMARSLAVTRGLFLASVHRELSVALVQSQGYVYRSCALLLAKASGWPVFPGAHTANLD